MKTLFLDCGMGAAGDMLTAALYELLEEEERKKFLRKINEIGLKNVAVAAEASVKCGISGTYMKVEVNGIEEDEYISTSGAHDHVHSGIHKIKERINELDISETVKNHVYGVYSLIAEAESLVHGVPVDKIHFHEVGDQDALTDIAAVCLLLEMLKPEKIIASPVHAGSGYVKCAHGMLPVPAPATVQLLKGIPAYGGRIKGELCTPTGAALLKYFVSDFGEMPVMKVEKVGYGMGKKDFECANCVRALLGDSEDCSEVISEFRCNLDDMTAEQIGYAMECLMEAGALDVYTVPAGMKKSRPGYVFCVMCREAHKDEILRLIFRHTTTLGIRETISRRYVLSRRLEKKETVFGELRVKRSEGYGVKREKYEYEDLMRTAKRTGLSIGEVIAMADKKEKL